MKKNIGKLNSFMRIAIGLMVLGCGTVKKCYCSIIIGSITAASGVTSFCPLLYMENLKIKIFQ